MGLGSEHEKARAALLAAMPDGAPCLCQPGCGPRCPCTSGPLPMHRDPTRNADSRPLEADHHPPRAHGNTGPPNRLLLSTCNRSRSDHAAQRIRTQGPTPTPGW